MASAFKSAHQADNNVGRCFRNGQPVVTLTTLIVLLASSILLQGCRMGGDVTSQLSTPLPSSVITAPIITMPSITPYYSNSASLVIKGICLDGSTMTLGGSTTAQTTCANSAFSFSVPESTDGVYFFLLTQTNASLGISNPVSLTWIRKSTVTPPILVSPTGPTYYSGLGTLAINGKCETGSVISLTGDGAGSAPCVDSQFTLSLPKGADGTYNLSVVQTDQAGNSASVPLKWVRQALTVSPSDTDLIVMTKQVLTISGGSGSYVLEMVSNNSGGTLDQAGLAYTPGPRAGVTDTLRARDPQGSSALVTIRTVAGAPDHLVLPMVNGNAQTAKLGVAYATPLTVQVTDQYGNAIPAYPLYFQTLAGDLKLAGTGLVTTDAGGLAKINATGGIFYPLHRVIVGSLSGSLPDLAGRGMGRYIFSETASSTGTGLSGPYFPTGIGPNATAVADFDGDGIADLAVLNPTEPSVGIFLGKGNGNFGPMTRLRSICNEPVAVAAGDLNNDGKPDLVVTCAGTTNKIAIALGNGDGTFRVPTVFPVAVHEHQPYAVVINDFDQDGNPDLAILGTADSMLNVHFGDGRGNFATPLEYPTGRGPLALVAADLNKDGFPDIAVANTTDNTIYLYQNMKNRTFQRVPGSTFTNSGPAALIAGDFDGDGNMDLAVAESNDNYASIYVGDSQFNLAQASSTSVGNNPLSLVAGDFYGNHKLDLAVANNGDSTITILKSVAGGNYVFGATLNSVSNPVGIVAADFTKHGKIDLAVAGNATSQIQLLPGHGDGTFGFNTTVGSGPVASVSADFDGDGLPDVAVINNSANTISVLKGDAKGFFSLLGTVNAGPSPVAIAAADLNGDGFMDLVVVNATGFARVLLGKGDGTFQAGISYGVGSSPGSLAVADLNHDGYPDIVITNSGSGSVSVLINKSNGTFNSRVNYPTADGPTGVAVGDFNGDGVLDLAVSTQTGNEISVLLGSANANGNATGTFQTHVEYPVDFGPVAIATADVNGDGRLDLITANANSISVLFGVGDGSFRTHADYAAGTNVTGMVVGDFNGDGYLDVVVNNSTSQTFTLLTSSRLGVFTEQSATNVGFNINGLSAGDFNKDSAIDLIIFNALNGTAQTWLGH